VVVIYGFLDAEFESGVSFLFYKMADPKWRPKVEKFIVRREYRLPNDIRNIIFLFFRRGTLFYYHKFLYLKMADIKWPQEMRNSWSDFAHHVGPEKGRLSYSTSKTCRAIMSQEFNPYFQFLLLSNDVCRSRSCKWFYYTPGKSCGYIACSRCEFYIFYHTASFFLHITHSFL